MNAASPHRAIRVVIVGGVAGGASTAARARRHSESAEIVLLERGPDVSFANCGLPYHIGGEIRDRGALAVQTPESLRALLNLEVRTGTEAIAVDPSSRMVRVRSLSDGTEEDLSYDKLVLCPGAHPFTPPLPGVHDPRVLTLRNLGDMDRINSAAASADRILVAGGGFIGLEMAEQLRNLDKEVTLVERNPEVLPQLDQHMAKALGAELEAHGITVVRSDGLAGFETEGRPLTAQLESGSTIGADLAILSIGVRPESSLARDAGLKLSASGHIVVDEYQRTSDPDIYAAGDACETADPILGGRLVAALGGPANRQGRTIADHIFLGGKALPYPGSLATAIVRVFGVAAGITGYSGKRLQAAGVPYETVTINAPQHASYFPGAETVTLKLAWSPADGRVLGAQAVGRGGVDKRLDVIATAIRGRLTIDDLAHLELSYAPPFGSAKDVVNIAGFAAGNVRDGLLQPVYTLDEAEGRQLIDVRPPSAVQKLPVPGAINIPLGQLRDRIGELDGSRPVYTICQMGKTSYFAARILANHGFEARSILGGAHHQVKNGC